MIFRERGTCKTDNQLIFSGDPGIDKVCLVEIEKKLQFTEIVLQVYV